MKIGLKTKESFLRIWKDSVWSKVISAGIIAAIAIAWAKITNHSWQDIYEFVIKVLSFKAPIFIFLSIVAAFFIIKWLIQFFKKKKDPFWDEQMGNYTFKELHNILLTESLPVQTLGMEISGQSAPIDNLLDLFRVYYIYLNKGIGFDDNIGDGGYLYNVLAPRLVGFGLVDAYQKPNEHLPDTTDVAYKTSGLGYKFHASIDKIVLANKLKELKSKRKAE